MRAPGLADSGRRLFFLGMFWVVCSVAPACRGAGVTIITHGFNGDVQGWVTGMANRMPGYFGFPGTNTICYEVDVSFSGDFVIGLKKVSGGRPTNDPTAEIVIKLDWSALAGLFSQYDTYEVAAAVVPRLLQTNFVMELGGHALAELPIHLIGHSRGGSLVCEMSRLLGTNGVWVDHVTTLDPHPVNEDGNSDPLLVSDAPLRIYDNVLFADNYYQEFGGYPHGQMMPSSYNRQLTSLPGGYSSAHSDMHLWYHSTIDLRTTANDTEAQLSASDRAAWFTAYETSGLRAGFLYSLLGGGNRLSRDQPAGSGSDQLADGYTQRWNLGAGAGANRTSLPLNTGNWPNAIKFNLTGTNFMAQGQSNSVVLYHQWARAVTSNATVGVYLDDDLNPWNGNERLVRQATVAATTATNVGSAALDINIAANNTTPGVHSLFVRISGGGRTRYAYAPELVTVVSSLEPPSLAVAKETPLSVRVDINGRSGQRIVLQSTSNFQAWQPLATNWLTTDRWSYFPVTPLAGRQFYRATVQ